MMTKEDWEAARLKHVVLPTLTAVDDSRSYQPRLRISTYGDQMYWDWPDRLIGTAEIQFYFFISTIIDAWWHRIDWDYVQQVFLWQLSDFRSPVSRYRTFRFCPELSNWQQVLITTQNMLFTDKLKIQDKVKLQTTKIHATRKDMVIAREEI